jgi:hypothetical protein
MRSSSISPDRMNFIKAGEYPDSSITPFWSAAACEGGGGERDRSIEGGREGGRESERARERESERE